MAPQTMKLAIFLFASLLQAGAIDKCPMLSKRDDGVINNPPSNDAFYLPPAGFETSSPGDILNIRAIGEKSYMRGSMYQILYRTADTLGKPQAAVTTVWVPQSGENRQLLSYQTPYNSVNTDCVPSFAVRDASTPESIGPFDEFDVATINAALANGWYVSMPDYNGPQAAFGSGSQAAQATLDGIRAVLGSSDCTGISPVAQVAMYGRSTGAYATEWAAEYKGSYAPELDVVGAAMAGLAPKLTTVISETNYGPYASYAPAILLGLSNAYPNVKRWLYESLVPATADYFFSLEDICGATAFFERFADQDISTYFTDPLDVLEDDRYLAAVGGSGIMGRMGPPSMPILVFGATNDQVSSLADTEDLVEKYCLEGGSVDYIEIPVGGHLQSFTAAADAAMTWLDLAFAGQTRAERCRSWNLTDSSIEPVSMSASTSTISASKTSSSTTTVSEEATPTSRKSTINALTAASRSSDVTLVTISSSSSKPASTSTALLSSPASSSSRRTTTSTATVEVMSSSLSSSRRTTTLTTTVEASSPSTSSQRRTTTLTTTVDAPSTKLSTSRRTTTLTSTVDAPSPSSPSQRRTTTRTTTVEPSPEPSSVMIMSVSPTVSPTARVRLMASSQTAELPLPTPQVTTIVSCKTLTSTSPHMTVDCQTQMVQGSVSGIHKSSATGPRGASIAFVIAVAVLASSLI